MKVGQTVTMGLCVLAALSLLGRGPAVQAQEPASSPPSATAPAEPPRSPYTTGEEAATNTPKPADEGARTAEPVRPNGEEAAAREERHNMWHELLALVSSVWFWVEFAGVVAALWLFTALFAQLLYKSDNPSSAYSASRNGALAAAVVLLAAIWSLWGFWHWHLWPCVLWSVPLVLALALAVLRRPAPGGISNAGS